MLPWKKVIVQMRHPYVPILTSRRKSGTSCFRGYKRFSYICFSTNYREFSVKKVVRLSIFTVWKVVLFSIAWTNLAVLPERS